MKPKTLFIRAILIFAVALSAFVIDNDPIADLLAKLEAHQQKAPQEKAYLHLDKPFYAAGDEIWFKAYIVDPASRTPSLMSNILYVELINQENQITKSLRLPMQAGITWGNLSLPDTLQEGNYRLRAYTNYMRNFGSQFIYDKPLKIGNSLNNNVYTKASHTASTTDDKTQLISQISFSNLDEQPYINSPVTYEIKLDEKIIDKGRTRTNDAGIAEIEAKNISPKALNDGVIIAKIKVSAETEVSKTIPIRATSNNVDIQLLPEGGHLVEGLPTKVGIKAVNVTGKGEDITGSLIDENGSEMLAFETSHLGIGNFIFTPYTTQTLKARIKFKNGSTKDVDLPTVEKSGYTLMINNADTGNLAVRIALTHDLLNQGAVTLVGTHNGLAYFSQKINTSNQTHNLNIAKRQLPSGIFQLTLFSPQGIPVNERIVFINNVQDKIDIQLSNVKTAYNTRSKVLTDFTATTAGNPIQGSFSVSVTNATVVKADEENESNILTSLLLTTDLAGYVEKPNYYFMGDKNAAAHLDNLLLTQGWRKIDWNRLKNNTIPPLSFLPEKDLRITGTIKRGNKPSPKSKVMLVSTQGGFSFRDTISDNNGHFVFDNLLFPDTAKFIIQARTAKDRKFVTIDVDRPLPLPATQNKNNADVEVNIHNLLNDYLAQSKKYFDEQIKNGLLNKTVILKEVAVTEKKNPAPNSSNLNGPGRADAVFTANDLQAGIPLSIYLSGRVAGILVKDQQVYSIRSGGAPMSVFLDGMNMGSDYNLDNINVFNVESVEILKPGFNSSVYGTLGINGVIIITSKRGGSAGYTRFAPGIITYAPGGYPTIKEFYSPKYDGPTDLLNDFRTTVYWSPQVITDDQGKGSFNYFTTDQPGTYRMVLEGIDLQGRLARKVITYRVE